MTATPPTQTAYFAYQTYKDRQGRLSIPKFRVSPAEYSAYLADTSTGAIRELFDAQQGLSVDTMVKAGVTRESFDSYPAAAPVDENAVNTSALLVIARDTVNGRAVRNVIPGRNAANYTSVKGDVILTGTDIALFITKYQAAALSDDGNALTVTEIKVVGR